MHQLYDHAYWDNIPIEKWSAYLELEDLHRLWCKLEKQAGGKLTEEFWLKEYPTDVREVLAEKLSELEVEFNRANDLLAEMPSPAVSNLTAFGLQTLCLVIQLEEIKKNAITRIFRIKRLLGQPISTSSTLVAEIDIERARSFPIQNLYTGKLRHSGARFTGLCPFHDEGSASFVIYPNNTFHCFGCGAHGDSIAFLMRSTGCDFKTAVHQLEGGSNA